VSSNDTFTGLAEEFATATPVSIDPICPDIPDDSAYKRNALPGGSAGTPASATVTPAPFRNEKTATPEGVRVPPLGIKRTDPVFTVAAIPAVCTNDDARPGML
jgi:hypothetical protein